MDGTQSTTATSESTPLLASNPSRPEPRPRAARNVTFNANPVSRTIQLEPDAPPPRPRSSHHHHQPHHGATSLASPGASSAMGIAGPPMLSALNSKLRRRNSSHGSPSTPTSPSLTAPSTALVSSLPKIGPQRSTKNAQKLKLLPNPDFGDEGPDEESGRDVYSQYTRIKEPIARRDAARLGKADRDRLPRVTAYCTANKYQMDSLMRFFKGRGKARGANPKLIDECIYTPYNYGKGNEGEESQNGRRRQRNSEGYGTTTDPVTAYERRHSTGDVSGEFRRGDLVTALGAERHDSGFGEGFGADDGNGLSGSHSRSEMLLASDSAIADTQDQHDGTDENPDLDIHVHTPEVFLFDYGVVVIWGMSLAHEQRFLKELAKFETEKLAPADVETELFNFYYTREYQARIYNDFITLRDRHNYTIKLAISHALAQSVKTSLFEELISSTIETCKDIPTQIALAGKISLNRSQINMQIGELFILRINVHLNGSVLDTPELFWVEPQLEPVYQAVRSYLEMDQRVRLLTERLDVIADLLQVLKDQLSQGHGEKLEWIVIVLIAAEILVAAISIFVDLYAAG